MEQYTLQSCKIPTLEQLIIMAQKEKEKRLSQEYIEMCDKVSEVPNGWLEVTSTIQENIIRDMGFTSELELSIALNRLRRAHILYPDEETFQNAIQVKNNLANKGQYILGSILPNFEICMIDTKKISIYNILNKKKLNLLIGSSHT